MRKLLYLIVLITLSLFTDLNAKEDFFNEAKNEFDKKNYEESKFLFQRNIVFNPKNAESYLYLAKIYEVEEDQKKTKKNIETALLLEPNNEEATLMLIEIELEKSNFSVVEELLSKFEVICETKCDQKSSIRDKLKNLQADG
jgi:tetratricopeptide (TPR) repeat protein|tara:strand:- start:9 stop:434 length:426 start_codon:yes stop_codon:yes gene_type:complete